MCAKFGCCLMVVSKRGGTRPGGYRQIEKGTRTVAKVDKVIAINVFDVAVQGQVKTGRTRPVINHLSPQGGSFSTNIIPSKHFLLQS